MTLHSTAHRLLAAAGWQVRRVNHQKSVDPVAERIASYIAGGRMPWSCGYGDYRSRFAQSTLANADLMAAFSRGESLPVGYGTRLCERCVEYPWIIARLAKLGGRLLDAGSTLNQQFLIERPEFNRFQSSIVTLAPEPECHWSQGISYVFADLRDLPYKDHWFDVVTCVSTLEHVGMDNSQFKTCGKDVERDGGSHLTAIDEMRRVLKPGGHLLLTVPFGCGSDLATSLIFNEQMIAQVIDQFAGECVEASYFRYGVNGWQTATCDECRDALYEPWIMLPADQRGSAFPDSKDGAAAARAVACLHLRKAST